MKNILVVEDESHLAEGLRFNLEAEGYQVNVVSDGESALEKLFSDPAKYSAVVLDVMLPGIDGFQVASQLRHEGQFVPIMMLTARGRPEDVLTGFEAGADDYLPKPFELAILIARLHGLIRRTEWQGKRTIAENGVADEEKVPNANSVSTAYNRRLDVFEFEGKTIDLAALELRANGGITRLTLMETELLRYLISHRDEVVSRKDILENVWNLHENTDTRAIDNFIVRLRKYIEDSPTRPRYLLTVRGVGYRFVPNPKSS